METSLTGGFNGPASKPRMEFELPVGGSGFHIGSALLLTNNVPLPDMTLIENEDVKTREAKRYALASQALKSLYEDMAANSDKIPVEIADIYQEQIETEKLVIIDYTEGGSSFDTITTDIMNGYSAEAAVYKHFEPKITRFLEKFPEEETRPDLVKKNLEYMERFRASLTQFLKGEKPKSLEMLEDHGHLFSPIPILERLPVGDLIHLRSENGHDTKAQAIIRAQGVRGDHTDIILRGLRMIIANMPDVFEKGIEDGDMIIISARDNKIIINPTEEELDEYIKLFEAREAINKVLTGRSWKTKWPQTANGREVRISANIGYADEMYAVNAANAAAIGLYRSEMAIKTRVDDGIHNKPGRADFLKIYNQILKTSIDPYFTKQNSDEPCAKTITMRTPDFLGDKNLEEVSEEDKKELIADSMEAMLIAAKQNPDARINIMFPMIKNNAEFMHMKSLLMDAADRCHMDERDLEALGIKVGCMIETPEAIENLSEIKADFISVGSNDLIPLILGYDRFEGDDENKKQKEKHEKYDPADPHVIDALMKITNESYQSGLHTSICGDIASDPRYTSLLLGLGFRNLSSGAGNVPMQKELVRRIDTRMASQLVTRLRAEPDRKKREDMLDDFNKLHVGLSPKGDLDMDENRWPWNRPEEGLDRNLEN